MRKRRYPVAQIANSEPNVLERNHNEAAIKFFTAAVNACLLADYLQENVRAITTDAGKRARLDELIDGIAKASTGLATYLDTILPPRSASQVAADLNYVAKGYPAENRLCDHKHYRFNEHGRYCSCGTQMCDPGD
jgi:hypothetical protein